jgi:type II secretory pathway component PulF
MPLFKFRVADRAGAIQDLLVEGANQADATKRLQSRHLLPLEFLGSGDGAATPRTGGLRPGRRFDVVDFTDRLVPLLQASIPLERALSILEETAESPQERELLTSFRRGLHEGRKFSALIRDRGRLFPRMYASIIEAGEESGALPQVLGQLRSYLAMTREMRTFILSSMLYPGFVLCFSIAVIFVLLGVVVPNFAKVIYTLNAEPDLLTSFILGLSAIVRGGWYWILLGVLGAVVAAIYALRQERVREWLDDVALRLPLVSRLVILANLGRQLRTMAILMRSGVHLLDTVTISAGVLQNARLRTSIASLGADLRRGERLSAALSRSPYIPALVIRMLAVGEETGETDVMLERVAERYDADLRVLVKRLLGWFEPLTILFMGGIVGVIVLMLFLLIIKMQSAF